MSEDFKKKKLRAVRKARRTAQWGALKFLFKAVFTRDPVKKFIYVVCAKTAIACGESHVLKIASTRYMGRR